MKNPRLLEYIPFYPKGVSEEYLAVKAGYTKPPYTDAEKGLRTLRKDLTWLSIRHPELVQRTERLQVSTERHLKDLDFPLPDKEGFVYLSRLGGAS